MIASSNIVKVVAALMALAVALCLGAKAFVRESGLSAGDIGVAQAYEAALFDGSEVLEVNIVMDEGDWEDMLQNAMSEQYYRCDVEVGGTTFSNVGIRPKGNTSLSSVASDPDTDRFSFKLEFDHFVDGQTCFGLDKLVLNGNYADATCMKEALVYDMFRYLGADAPLYTYAKVSVDGQYWGLYLALEAVEDSFLVRNYGAQDGELYKPDGVGGGGAPAGEAPEGEAPAEMGEMPEMGAMPTETAAAPTEMADMSAGMPETGAMPATGEMPAGQRGAMGGMADMAALGEMPEMGAMPTEMAAQFEGGRIDGGGFGGMGMGGNTSGADLNYAGDDLDSYSAIWDSAVTDSTDADHRRVVEALCAVAAGEVEDAMDVENLLRYMAVHVFSVNDDSLTGSMAHNYYLYESAGRLNVIPWDYNLAFGGMGMSGSASGVVNDPVDGAFAATDFFDALVAGEDNLARYHELLAELVDGYVLGGAFDEFYERVRGQIDALVEQDPTAFYSYEEYLTAVQTLYDVVKLRAEAVKCQVEGDGTSSVDAGEIDLTAMGGMGGMRDLDGMGGMRQGAAGDMQNPGAQIVRDGAAFPAAGDGAAQPPAAGMEAPEAGAGREPGLASLPQAG